MLLNSVETLLEIISAFSSDMTSGVSASIVAYPNEAGVYISARSIGDLNVQLIMESLGGGGNRNAAACQMEGVSIEQALDKIHQAIDEYLAS